jgi:Protein of unknown function (DUF3500)
MMKKPLAVLVLLSVVGAGGYIWWSGQMSTALAAYTNKEINLGGVDVKPAAQICHSTAGHDTLLCIADTLKKSLSREMLAKLQRPYAVADAKKWSNFPPRGYGDRVGPTLGEFTPEQLVLVKSLLKAAAGIAANEGYDEMEQILNADEYLAANTSDSAGFASGNYHIAFLGEPAAKGTWELYFGGHHLAFGNTYADGKLVGATPSFRGVEPFTPFQQNGRENAPMLQEQAAFASMLNGLDSSELAKAKLDQAFTNIIVGPQQDENFPSLRDGLRVGELGPEKQALVLAAIETYVRDISASEADVIMTKYKAELVDTYIAFSGTPGINAENDYVRIDGPSIWIECSMQPGRSLPGIHPHSVWRDRASDYGGNK